MSDYGTIKARIASELNRTDLTNQISLSVQSAIQAYEHECFWFNESRDITFDTASMQEFYNSDDNADIPNLLLIHQMTITVNSQRYKLEPRLYQQLEEWAVNASLTGQPTDFAYYNQRLRLYPIPDTGYPVRVSGRIRLDPLTQDDDTNSWMTDAEQLIRYRAKVDLFENSLFDTQNADRQRLWEAQALQRLRTESGRRLSTGSILPTYF